MRPSKNAFIGYTYQEQITFLLLAMMDVERKIDYLEIEADVNSNFDDVKASFEGSPIYCQIKDLENIQFKDLKISTGDIIIKGRKHNLASESINVLFFKEIGIIPNCEFLGLPAFKNESIYIISLSRTKSNSVINELYKTNEQRKIIIDKFFTKCLDNRMLSIKREDLPIIKVYDTKLLENSIDIGKRHLKFSNLLHIEGKPGVGKSHYVNTLSTIYKDSLVYRFWISNQDKDYKTRLVYSNFISDVTKKLFQDYVYRNETQIIDKIEESKQMFIIDGLDHVENYNEEDLEKFLKFINQLSARCKSIVLSRPLKIETGWKKQVLLNWNEKETKKVLNELYHIDNYSVCSDIYNITDGYPILVKFIGEHYKEFKELPNLEKLEGIEDYYNQILRNVNTKSALTIFLTSQSFFMESELKLFLAHELYDCLEEFIKAYPYLFERRLNRIVLFHDSLNKYLKELGINYLQRKENVNQIVFESIIRREKRFMSRFAYFDLNNEMKLEIIEQFSSIAVFKDIVKNCIDFEAIRDFFNQLRQALSHISHHDLKIRNYYDLSLIINIVNRDHISTLNQFLYTYIKSLLFHGYSLDDITSSEYLFGMLTYVVEKDPVHLYNTTSDALYSTTRFLEELENDVLTEEEFFLNYAEPIELSKPIDHYLMDDFHWREYLTQILTSIYIHKTVDETLLELQHCIDTFIDDDENKGIQALENIFDRRDLERRFPHWVLNDVKKNLYALGKLPKNNPYLNLTLKNYIQQYSSVGSFDMWVSLLSYLRLALEQKKKIDIESIGLFWCMYYRRKDYSIINMNIALKVFEENGLIDEEESIKRVVFAQHMSEKGIRHLLREYVSDHDPSIILKVLKSHDLNDLNIIWFDLPSNHISAFPEKVFNHAMNTLWSHNRFRKEVKFDDIANVFYSTKWEDLLENLRFFRFKICVSQNIEEFKKLENIGLTIVTKEEEEVDNMYSSGQRFDQGILDSRDKKFIIEKGLNPVEISGYLNSNYAALEDLEVYKIFDKEDIKHNLKEILHNAVLGKVKSINSYGSLFYLVGNIPKLINTYQENPNMIELYQSFETFLELSMLGKKLLK